MLLALKVLTVNALRQADAVQLLTQAGLVLALGIRVGLTTLNTDRWSMSLQSKIKFW